jgi:hypothetical protein
VTRPLGITAILLCAVAAACGQPPNPILGKWALSMPPGAKYAAFCPTAMEFTSTSQTLTYAGKPVAEKVNYNAAQTTVYPTTVYVMGGFYHSFSVGCGHRNNPPFGTILRRP